MFRWSNISTYDINGNDQKMYRDIFISDNTVVVESKNKDMDHIAYDYLGSELDMYKVMDINALAIIEERGNMSRITKLDLPNI